MNGRQEDFHRFFDDVPIGVALLDAGQRIAACNATFRALAGCEDPAGRPFIDFIVEGQRMQVARRLAAAAQGKGGQPPVDAYIAGDQERVANVFISCVGGDGERRLLVHLIDTTEQKKLEQKFAQSQKMQAVGQLAGGIAHDFNNLLTAMIGFCDLLLQRYRPGEQSFADVMQIKQNANRGAALVRQLLAFSRQQTLQPRRIQLGDVIGELSNLLRRLLGETVELRLVHGRDLAPVKVDQGQLEQVIINLAVNARDAMPDGGRLTIETANEDVVEPVEVHGEIMPPGRYVTLSVTDTGVGIAAEDLEHIFEPFFTTKEVGSGTGLGLSTVYGIVKQTGGYVLAESPGPGRGARFTIYFPRYEGAADEAGSEASEGEGAMGDVTGGETVLLVEDEDPVRLFGARALRSKGYKVVEARTGEAALELLRGQSFDLLITDMVMPRVGGAEVIREARRLKPDLPVVCISGYTEEAVIKEVETIENVYFLAKPFSLKQLAGTVKNAIRKAPRTDRVELS